MLIDPNVKKLVIFNSGGGIVEREIKIQLNRGSNEFEIQNVPASFDPNSAEIKIEFINPEDNDKFTLQQTIVSLPDKNNSQQIIDREKSAANSIISYAIDFTREMRERISGICEASSYRTYSDMNATFNFILNAKKKGEVIVKIIYFISDARLRWNTTLQVNINEDGKSAEIEGYLVADNQTGYSYDDVEMGFAIFELPKPTSYPEGRYPPINQQDYVQEIGEELNQLVSRPKAPMKRTQRFKQLL